MNFVPRPEGGKCVSTYSSEGREPVDRFILLKINLNHYFVPKQGSGVLDRISLGESRAMGREAGHPGESSNRLTDPVGHPHEGRALMS